MKWLGLLLIVFGVLWAGYMGMWVTADFQHAAKMEQAPPRDVPAALLLTVGVGGVCCVVGALLRRL